MPPPLASRLLPVVRALLVVLMAVAGLGADAVRVRPADELQRIYAYDGSSRRVEVQQPEQIVTQHEQGLRVHLAASGELNQRYDDTLTTLARTDPRLADYRLAPRAISLADDAVTTGRTASPSWGRTIDDFQQHGDQWRRVTAHAEGATGRAYRGGTSIEEVFERGGDRLIRHRIYGPNGEVLHETFRPYAKFGAP